MPKYRVEVSGSYEVEAEGELEAEMAASDSANLSQLYFDVEEINEDEFKDDEEEEDAEDD